MEFNLQKIKGKMKEKKITYVKLAEYLDITTQAVTNKLNGKSDFKHSQVTKIFDILDIKKDEISNFFTV